MYENDFVDMDIATILYLYRVLLMAGSVHIWDHYWQELPTQSESEQDHQRWGYITVTHLEQPVYLAIWKDLNKEKRK